MDINTVILCGRLTKDIEIRYTPAGKAVGTFTLAYSKKWIKDGQKQEKTSFFNIVCFGKTAENTAKYMGKGDEIAVRGELQQERWEREGQKFSKVVIMAQDIKFGQKAKSNQTPQEQGGMDDLGGNPPF